VTPGKTAHPLDPSHTPGGSSSGSAAAVADFMVPAALGTQTGGSVIRPAAFCGVFGYKPSFGRFNRAGVKPAAESLDTIGLIARTIDDLRLLDSALVGEATAAQPLLSQPPVVGLCRTHLWKNAESATVAAIEDAAVRLAAAGAKVVETELPDEFAALTAARERINNYVRARALAYEWHHHREQISERLCRAIERGFALSHEDYSTAMALTAECRARIGDVFDDVEILLTPATPGEAPKGLDFTGDPRFQEMWTQLHVPTLTLPTHRGPNGLPVGIQLVAPIGGEDRLFAIGTWIWDRLRGA
jgi:Asp-tRNA(Asn)/Glu-tRNA(Gln) amidotransferase A subunit family amidase